MTMSSSVSKVTLNGDGVQTSWPFSFKVWKADDLEVSITNSEGAATVVANWSVVLAGTGGTVTYPTAGDPLPLGHKITIARSMDFLQDVDLVSGTRWDPEVVETALDQATAERQQLKERLDRAVVVDIADSTTPAALRDAIFEARDTAVDNAASALDSAERAEIAATTVAYYNHEGTLLTGESVITLPWAYDTSVGVKVYLSGVKQTESTLVFTNAYTVTLTEAVTADTPFEVVASAGARADLAGILSSEGGSNLVGFLQAGTGAVARTVQAKLRDVVSAKDFGAVGDGVTDDTAAIQTAIDRIYTKGGGTLRVPAGQYVVGTLFLKYGVCLEGDSVMEGFVNTKGTVFKPSGTLDSVHPSVFVLKNESRRGAQLKNITINMATAPAVCNAIELAGVWYSRFDNIFIVNMSSATHVGIFTHAAFEGTYWNIFNNILITGSDPGLNCGTGVVLKRDNIGGGSSTSTSNQNTFTQIACRWLDYGYRLYEPGAGNVFINCQAEGISQTGFVVETPGWGNGHAVWIGGEVNKCGNGAFKGRVRVIDCAINNMYGGQILSDYAFRDRIQPRDSPSTVEHSINSTEHYIKAISHYLIAVDNTPYPVPRSCQYLREFTNVPAGTAFKVLRFPVLGGASGQGSGMLNLRAQRFDALPGRNVSIMAHISWRYQTPRIAILSTLAETLLTTPVLTGVYNSTDNTIDFTFSHGETQPVNIWVEYNGMCTQYPIVV